MVSRAGVAPPAATPTSRRGCVLGAGEGRTLRVTVEDVRVQGAPPAARRGDRHRRRSTAFAPRAAGRPSSPRTARHRRAAAGARRDPGGGGLAAARQLATCASSSAAVSARGMELSWAGDAGQAPQTAGADVLGYEARRALDAREEAPRGHERAELAHKLALACEARERRGRRAWRRCGCASRTPGPGATVGHRLAAAGRAVRAARRSARRGAGADRVGGRHAHRRLGGGAGVGADRRRRDPAQAAGAAGRRGHAAGTRARARRRRRSKRWRRWSC